MDPVSIISVAALVIEGAAKIASWIDQALKKAEARQDALQKLRDALMRLGDDIEFYKKLLSQADKTTFSRANFTNFKTLEKALRDSKAFLDKVKRAHPVGSDPPSEAKITSYQSQVERYREENKKAFKLLWYSLRKDIFKIHFTVDTVPHAGGSELANALDTVSSLFNGHPFVTIKIRDPNIPNILNSNRYAIEQYEQVMQRVGKGWVEDRVRFKESGDTNPGIYEVGVTREVQVYLFEILWTMVIGQLKVPVKEKAASKQDSTPEVLQPQREPLLFKFEMCPSPDSQEEMLSEPPPYSPREQEPEPKPELELEPELVSSEQAAEELEKLGRKLQLYISLAKNPVFTTAFCGIAKAGKSLFLTALIGTQILPSDEFPSTAWPCRVRHVEGQKEPELQYDQAPFLEALEKLREWKYGAMMKQFKPPTCIDDDTPRDQVEGMKIWRWWNDLHPKTKYHLERFEDPSFQLDKSARGMEAVGNLLFQINDIVRIYQRFGQVFGVGVTDWPLLTLEFVSLRGRTLQDTFEFIDLPGMGERLQQFRNLVKVVARRSDAIVPVVSLLNMQHDESLETLPNIINECDIECNAVVCTNMDRVDRENKTRQNTLVTGAFWPHRGAPPRPGIIRCSSLMGISAQTLLTQSQNGLPIFQTFWKPNIGYHAAEKILGARGEKVYKTFDHEEWNEEIMKQVEESGLPSAIEVLFKDIVSQARPRTMLQELRYVYRVVYYYTGDYSRILEGARRTKSEYDQAKAGFEQDKISYDRILREWKAEEEDKVADLNSKISHHLREAEAEAKKLILKAFQKVIQNQNSWMNWSLLDQIKEVSDGVWELKINAYSLEEFLRLSQEQLAQSLDKLRVRIAPHIEKLQQEACKERAESLITRIQKSTFQGDILKQQIERNTTDELSSTGFVVKVETNQIRDIVVEKYDFFTAFKATLQALVNGRALLKRATVRTDTIMETFQRDVVAPWVQEMERLDANAIGAVTRTAETIFIKFLRAEETRFGQELEQMVQPMDERILARKVMIYGNLVATKAALEELIHRTEACIDPDTRS